MNKQIPNAKDYMHGGGVILADDDRTVRPIMKIHSKDDGTDGVYLALVHGDKEEVISNIMVASINRSPTYPKLTKSSGVSYVSPNTYSQNFQVMIIDKELQYTA